MRIAQVASLWASIPPKTYGGIESMVDLLVEGLIRRGHEVTLFASGDSITSGILSAVCEHGISDAMRRGEAYDYDYYATAAMAEVMRRGEEFDVIHCHIGCSKIPLGAVSKTPMLHTLHTSVTQDDCWVIRRYPHVAVAAISKSQVASIPVEDRHSIQVVYNSYDFGEYELSDVAGEHLVFLGRMNANKNPLDAIRIAQAVGLPIILAGAPETDLEQVYFDTEIKPLIDGQRVRYIGRVDTDGKRDLFKNAGALLFPVMWEEPFGLVMIEAMASGVPVLAYKRGAVPEVIDTGITGFYADSPEGIVSLLPQALALDRAVIREHAFERFNHHRMIDEYVALFESITHRRK